MYRLTIEAETKFNPNTIILGGGTICPFNSQNTLWWPEAYPLLYLPSFVSFRMTDIWRSFVAQVCLYQTGKHLAFRDATVYQTRNEHSLIKDFKDEVPGYPQQRQNYRAASGLIAVCRAGADGRELEALLRDACRGRHCPGYGAAFN